MRQWTSRSRRMTFWEWPWRRSPLQGMSGDSRIPLRTNLASTQFKWTISQSKPKVPMVKTQLVPLEKELLCCALIRSVRRSSNLSSYAHGNSRTLLRLPTATDKSSRWRTSPTLFNIEELLSLSKNESLNESYLIIIIVLVFLNHSF